MRNAFATWFVIARMAFLIIDNERYALQMGETVLGGFDDDVLSLSPLAGLAPFAVLTCDPDGAGSIKRLRGDEAILIDGQPLGDDTRSLKHGNHLTVAGLDITYGEMRAAGGTAHIGSVSIETLSSFPVADATGKLSNGRVVRLSDGRTTFIPAEGLEIGRDPTCGLVLASKSVSRYHAEIVPFQAGYRLTDRSRNGAFVNGTRVGEPQLLYNGDVIRLGTEELRFEAN